MSSPPNFEGRKEVKIKNKKILALRCALLIAVSEAEKAKDTEDGGTSNFDNPVIVLKSWKRQDIEEAFKLTGLRPYFESNGVVEILNSVEGQGFRRTAMAEAFRDSLRASGYISYVRYQMD